MDLVVGPFRPALESAFVETFRRLRRQEPLAPLAVVAPSRRLADRLKLLALEAVPEGFAAARFFNLFSFARRLYEESAPEGARVLLDDLVPSRLLRAILRRHFAGERYLSRAHSPGALVGALHELKAAAVEPDAALALLAEEELGLEEAPKLAELLSLYKRYSEELRRRKLHVRADVIRRAAEHAPASAFLGSLRHVLYYGFYELDQNQIDLFREVRRRTEVTCFFPCEDRPEYAYAREFLDAFIAPLARARRDLPADEPRPKVSQISASGAHDEVWAAAKEILRWADQGIPYDEIGVVARTLEPYADLVDAVFREHRIPYTSSARRRLDRDPRVKAARLLFSLEDFDRADVLDLLRSPFFRRPGGDPDLWDQASRLMGIGRGADVWRRRLGGAAGKDYVCDRGARAGKRPFVLPRSEVDLFWESVRGLLEAPPPPTGGWADFASWALERLRRFLHPDPRVEAAVEGLAALEGLAFEEPLEVLLEQLARLAEPAGGAAGVQVLDAMAARGLSFRALVVLGLNERVFPRFILEDPFFSDAVRARFEARLGCRFPRKLRGYEEETLLFFLLRRSADEIVLSYQRSDEQGRLQIPSSFLPEGPVRPVPRRPAERLRETPFELLTPREASLRTGQGEALGRALGWDVTMLVNGLSFLRAIESRGPLTPYDGTIDAGPYWNAVAAAGFSPTALERLADCPFRYFASQILDLEELEEPEGETALTALDAGNLYHDILERYYRGGDLARALEEGFRRVEESRAIRYPVLWEVEKEAIRKVLEAFVRADDVSTFKPRDFETELRGELPLAVGGRRSVAFRGFADRLDLDDRGAFRVVDYKRSRSRYSDSIETGVFKKGRYLQAPLYFVMAAERFPGADRRRSRFVYYFLEEMARGEDGVLEFDGALWDRRAEFEALLARLLDRVARGEFPIRVGWHCGTCPYGTMCRKSHLPTRWRAEEHERRATPEA
ncbi:MAG TPA: PD-(D/E)XK nuclease family protein [Planctomycetota bacterium]|nr:PD-(D/E)XK nuclease family protein [Planctomycetota bacterium]